MKNVREIEQVFKGDDHHDDAPKLDWETEIQRENKRFESKLRKQRQLLELKKRKKEKQVNKQDGSKELSTLKIRPNESLRDFNSRVDNEARLLQSAQAIQERNKRRKLKREEKAKARAELAKDDDWEDYDRKVDTNRPWTGLVKTAEAPPELGDIQNNKKRFLTLAEESSGSKSDQMASLLNRVQSLYKRQRKQT